MPSQPGLPSGLQAAHLVLLGLTLLPAPTLPSDGFMQDFFARLHSCFWTIHTVLHKAFIFFTLFDIFCSA